MRASPLTLFMTTDAVGGVFTYAADLARGLVPYGVKTRLCVVGPPMSPAQKSAAAGIAGLDLVTCPAALDWMAPDAETVLAAGRELARLAEGADVVQLNAPTYALAPFPAPVVGVVHSCLASWWGAVRQGPLPADFAWRTDLLRRAIGRLDALACPSRSFADTVAEIYGRRPTVVRNGRAAREFVEPGQAPVRAFTAGRLWDQGKNVETLDRAAALMSVPLRAAGPLTGPEGSRMSLDHAQALGSLDEADMRAELARRPIFVTAALYEPFGLTALEAAQASCALVLADIPTFRELWEGAALFVPPRDAQGFATAVDRLTQDDKLRHRLGCAAEIRSRRYRVDAMAAAMAEIYRRLARPTDKRMTAPAAGAMP